jgi:Leucine-rich repeat (LRR) protein
LWRREVDSWHAADATAVSTGRPGQGDEPMNSFATEPDNLCVVLVKWMGFVVFCLLALLGLGAAGMAWYASAHPKWWSTQKTRLCRWHVDHISATIQRQDSRADDMKVSRSRRRRPFKISPANIYEVRDSDSPRTSPHLVFSNPSHSLLDLYAPTEAEVHRLQSLAVLRGLPLRSLWLDDCGEYEFGLYGRPVADLGHLEGARLEVLKIRDGAVRDLTPLAGMPLRHLHIEFLDSGDLSPLSGLPLESLRVSGHKIRDLSPLKGLPLKELHLEHTGVRDLSPLAGMQLEVLNLRETHLTELTSLTGVSVKTLDLTRSAVRDLRGLAGMPLEILSLRETKVTDLTPLSGLPLKELDISLTAVMSLRGLESTRLQKLDAAKADIENLEPLRGLPLQTLIIAYTDVEDLEPLGGCPLVSLVARSTKINDLSPLAGARLRLLDFNYTTVDDLTPLRGMDSLRELRFAGSHVFDRSPIRDLPLFEYPCRRRGFSSVLIPGAYKMP